MIIPERFIDGGGDFVLVERPKPQEPEASEEKQKPKDDSAVATEEETTA